MKKYSPGKIHDLIADRKGGMSVMELMDKYEMPKTSVWHHVKSIQLDSKKIKMLQSRRGGAFARKQKSEAEALKEANKIMELVDTDSTAPLVVSSLYWAEGHKKSFTFTNTDPNMVKVFLSGMERCFGVKKSQWSLLIRITQDKNKHRIINYWNRVTDVPKANIKLNADIENNKSKAINGICRFTLRKGGYQLKIIHALIRAMADRLA